MSQGAVNISNKKARFEYELHDEFTAGIQLTGPEIKSVRESKASIKEAFCLIIKGEMWIRNMHISPFEPASYNNSEPKRDRKLLLNRQEIQKIEKRTKAKGYTIVPLKVFIAESGYAKIKIATASGKKLHDKREGMKDKDAKRQLDRVKKGDY